MAREDLSPIEEARACAALVEELGLTREEVGRRVGRGRVAVSNLVRLLDLPDEVIELLQEGALSEGHGRALLLAEDHGARDPAGAIGGAGGVVGADRRSARAGGQRGAPAKGREGAASEVRLRELSTQTRSRPRARSPTRSGRRSARRSRSSRRATADTARRWGLPRPRRRSNWLGGCVRARLCRWLSASTCAARTCGRVPPFVAITDANATARAGHVPSRTARGVDAVSVCVQQPSPPRRDQECR